MFKEWTLDQVAPLDPNVSSENIKIFIASKSPTNLTFSMPPLAVVGGAVSWHFLHFNLFSQEEEGYIKELLQLMESPEAEGEDNCR